MCFVVNENFFSNCYILSNLSVGPWKPAKFNKFANTFLKELELIINNMQFLLIAYDGTDSGALQRRLAVREDHLNRISAMKKEGKFLLGGAILDDTGKMIGSMIVYDFPDLQSLKESLKDEQYQKDGVWENIEIRPFRLAKID